MTHDVTWITEKELEREIKNKRDEFCWKNNMNILYRRWENEKCQRSEKKNHQGKKWAALKKANSNTSNKIFGEHRRHIFFITSVTRKSDVVVVENNGKEMYKKSVLRLQSFFYCYLVYWLFCSSRCRPWLLCLAQFRDSTHRLNFDIFRLWYSSFKEASNNVLNALLTYFQGSFQNPLAG